MFFERARSFSCRNRKRGATEDGGRILLGNNTGREAVMLWPIGFQCDGVWNRLDSLVYTYIVDRKCNQFRRALTIAGRNYCLRRGS